MSPAKTVAGRLAAILEDALGGLSVGIPALTLLSGELQGGLFVEPSTAVVVRAGLTGQLEEPLPHFTLSASVRLTVRLCDDVDGAVFAQAHERLWNALLALATGDGCETLGGADFAVDGFALGGGEESALDASAPGGGAWTCAFSASLNGRVLNRH